MADTPQGTFPFPILVVEDTLLQRTMLENSLKAAGYEVVTAENGRKALEIFNKGYFPIVMTDWVMPEMDGLELCRAIRNDTSNRYTYIILLTSQDSKNDIIAGLDAGADEYLIKPAHQAELLTRLKTAKRILNLESSLQRWQASPPTRQSRAFPWRCCSTKRPAASIRPWKMAAMRSKGSS